MSDCIFARIATVGDNSVSGFLWQFFVFSSFVVVKTEQGMYALLCFLYKKSLTIF
ncbi:hypothetical protein GYO_2329 [Bacillus spizizenii TU-B-10]|uniref:Uncharacterized protein n=1 Tax=Bacillus spizizenii (strain DSM 15029 / JCM 12233 / NBRC 101239 / NRRL B-23049 / TU-B-10) TaxID=1052585 RepID=G4NQ22_BACS4|nr:hypothetical protein GYO_2329 [Bacillus spizizenii TU-B-10]